MGIQVDDLREYIIRPTLQSLDLESETFEKLLLGTAARESNLGLHSYCHQTQGLGLYRITPEKHLIIWDKFLIQFPELASRQRGLASQQQFLKTPHAELATNLSYATGIAVMIYLAAGMKREILMDTYQLAHYWAEHFDNGTKATRLAEAFEQSYHKQVLRDNRKLVA
jgi:hypothetical protein